jgi:hypothetical protein
MQKQETSHGLISAEDEIMYALGHVQEQDLEAVAVNGSDGRCHGRE